MIPSWLAVSPAFGLAGRHCRFKHLLARSTILRELTAERETLLAQLTALVESMDGEYEAKASASTSSRSRGAGSAVAGRNVSGVVVNLGWAQAVRSKVSAGLLICAVRLQSGSSSLRKENGWV